MSTDWKDYQEKAAAFFRSIGMEAETDVTVAGARTKHNVDVVVRSHHAGFDITWLVECKHWKTAVTKLHVLALREIVADTGADRGVLLCEAGFQSGAIEAANLTNVRVTSLALVRETAAHDIAAMRLRELYDRIESCRTRYWDIPKRERIERGLRPEVADVGYSGAQTIEVCNDLLSRAFRGVYPLQSDSLLAHVILGPGKQFHSPSDVLSTVEPLVQELESKLAQQ
jgi:restriction system protein